MAENVASTQGNGDVPGQPFYEQSRLELRKMLKRQALLQAQLAQQEEMIYKKETEYLEDTPAGNIIVGFDSYTKGTASTAAGGARRKAQVSDSSRLFSRSSITWNADSPGLESAQSTPMAAMAPTPMSTSFQKGDSVSNHATPTSASSVNRVSAAGGASAAGKKNKKPADEDEDDERRDVKKARSVSGAVARK